MKPHTPRRKLRLLLTSLGIGLIASQTSHAALPASLPPIPEQSINPHFAAMWSGMKLGVTTVDFSTGTLRSAANTETRTCVFAYLHPQSPYYQQQAVLDRLLVLIDAGLNPANVGPAYTNYAYSSYAMLKHYQPSAIPPAMDSTWTGWVNTTVSGLITQYPRLFNNSTAEIKDMELNLDQRWANHVYFGGLAVGNAAWVEQGRQCIEEIFTRALLADGGTHYVGYQNEGANYHGLVMYQFMEYWILSRSPSITHALSESRIYTSLISQTYGRGYNEWTSSPAWKAQYNATIQNGPALMSANLDGDGYSATIANNAIGFYEAFFYKSGVTPLALPDNYTVFDRNIQGPRFRYGTYGAVGVGRNVQFGAPEVLEVNTGLHSGKNSLAGSFVLNTAATSSQDPLIMAFHGAMPQIKVLGGAEGDWNRGNIWNFMTTGEQVQTSRSQEVYGLSSSYRPTYRGFTPSTKAAAWDMRQQWVLTPTRIIGVNSAESNASSQLYGLSQRIAFVGSSLTRVDDNTFTGPLNLKIHDKNYTGPVSNFGYSIRNDADPLRWTSPMVQLHDIDSSKDSTTLVTYPAGTSRYAVMEINPSSNAPATDVARLSLAAGLSGFEFTENGNRKVRLVHNITASPISYTASLVSPFPQTRLLKSWEVETPAALAVSAGATAVSISIPAYSHILLVNSSVAADHTGGFRKAEDVFVGYAPLRNGEVYELEPKHARLLRLEVAGSSGTNGAALQVATRTGATNQRWKAELQADGSFEIYPLHNTTKRMDVNGRSTANGAALISWQDNNGTNQRWKAVKQDDGYVELFPMHATASRAQVRAAGTTSPTPVELWSDTNQPQQRWKMLEVK